MPNRRALVWGSAAAIALVPLSACKSENGDTYDKVAAELRSPLADRSDIAAFVRCATLAPNGHNAQPWRFTVGDTGASILPDFTRRTPVVDPDDHHLFVSLGCATENFLIAAEAKGRPAAMSFDASGEGRIDIDLGFGRPQVSDLYRGIPARQSTRSTYDGRPVSSKDLRDLEAAAQLDGVTVIFLTDPEKREGVLEHLIAGNNAQMADPKFVAELKEWIRFNSAEAMEKGDGLFSRCTGNPKLPTWLGKRIFSLVYKKESENAKYTEQMRSSAGVAIFIGDKADKDHWVRVGRSFQRFALQATVLEIRHALINQPVEVPQVRAEFSRWLGIGATRPDLVVRFGRATQMPMSMRRPTEAVMVPRS